MNKQQLAAKIWESANQMRSKIEANEYKDYILGFIFYKYLSDQLVQFVTKEGIAFIETMAHMGNGVMGIAFDTAATICEKGGHQETKGAYFYVENDDLGEGNRSKQFPLLNERNLNAAKSQGR